jgi:hypothetical protein
VVAYLNIEEIGIVLVFFVERTQGQDTVLPRWKLSQSLEFLFSHVSIGLIVLLSSEAGDCRSIEIQGVVLAHVSRVNVGNVRGDGSENLLEPTRHI